MNVEREQYLEDSIQRLQNKVTELRDRNRKHSATIGKLCIANKELGEALAESDEQVDEAVQALRWLVSCVGEDDTVTEHALRFAREVLSKYETPEEVQSALLDDVPGESVRKATHAMIDAVNGSSGVIDVGEQSGQQWEVTTLVQAHLDSHRKQYDNDLALALSEGWEIVAISANSERDTGGDYPVVEHHRIVTLRRRCGDGVSGETEEIPVSYTVADLDDPDKVHPEDYQGVVRQMFPARTYSDVAPERGAFD